MPTKKLCGVHKCDGTTVTHVSELVLVLHRSRITVIRLQHTIRKARASSLCEGLRAFGVAFPTAIFLYLRPHRQRFGEDRISSINFGKVRAAPMLQMGGTAI